MDGEIEVGTEVMVIDPGGGNVVTVAPASGDEDEIDRALARGRREADDGTTPGADADADTEPESGDRNDLETERN
jgi:hypothetical protein